MDAGRLKEIVRFERRGEVDDGYGNTQGAWAVISGLASVRAAFRPEFGRESVEAGRLQATMRGTLTVRAWADTKGVTPADRVAFMAGPYAGIECQIRSKVPTPDGAFIEFVLESGVAL